MQHYDPGQTIYSLYQLRHSSIYVQRHPLHTHTNNRLTFFTLWNELSYNHQFNHCQYQSCRHRLHPNLASDCVASTVPLFVGEAVYLQYHQDRAHGSLVECG
jgi:hypothetical protein